MCFEKSYILVRGGRSLVAALQVVRPASWGGSHLQSNSNPNSTLARPQTGAAASGLAIGGPSQSHLNLNAQPSVSARPGSATGMRPATAARYGVQSSIMGSASDGSSANYTWSRSSKSTFGVESLQLSQKLGSIASGKVRTLIIYSLSTSLPFFHTCELICIA